MRAEAGCLLKFGAESDFLNEVDDLEEYCGWKRSHSGGSCCASGVRRSESLSECSCCPGGVRRGESIGDRGL